MIVRPERSIALKPHARIKQLLGPMKGVLATVVCVGGFFLATSQGVSAQSNQQLPLTGNSTALSSTPVQGITQSQQPAFQQPTQDIQVRKDQLLLKSRRALAEGDVPSAERFVAELREMNLTYSPREDQPNLIAELIRQHKEVNVRMMNEGATESNRKAVADLLARQSLGLLYKGDLETAEKLALTADAQGVQFSPEAVQKGFDPKSILQQIRDIRLANRSNTQGVYAKDIERQPVSLAVQKQIAQAGELLAKGRVELSAGRTEQAERYAREAAGLGIPDSSFPQGVDTPGRLLSDVAAKRLGNANNPVGNNIILAGTPNSGQGLQQGVIPAVYDGRNDSGSIQQVSSIENNPLRSIQGEATPLQAPTVLPRGEMGGLLDQSERFEKNLTEQMNTELSKDISAAYRLRSENPDGALNMLLEARAKIENSDLDPYIRQQGLRQIDFAIDATRRFREQNRPQLELKETNTQILEEMSARRDEKDFIEQKIKELCEQVSRCLDEGRYEDALYLANKAKEFAPEHPTVKLLYTATKTQNDVRAFDEIRQRKEEGFVGAMMDVQRAAIPYNGTDPLQYDAKRWEKVRGRKGMDEMVGSSRPERELEILRKLDMPVRLDFEDEIPLGELISYLQGYTGIMIMADLPALRDVDVTTDLPVRVQIPGDISLRSALNLTLGQHKLTYVVEDELLKITTPARSRGKLTTRLYYVGNLFAPNSNLFRTDGGHSMEAAYGRGIEAAGRLRSQMLNGTQPVGAGNETYRIDPSIMPQINPGGLNGGNASLPLGGGAGGGADVESIINMIKNITGEDNWDEEETGATIEPYENGLSIVVKQTEEIHAEIADLLKQLRKMNDTQITIEVRFITITDEFFERIGMDFDLNFTNKGAQGRGISIDYQKNDDGTYKKDANGNLIPIQIGGDNVVVGMSTPGVYTNDFGIPLSANSYGPAIPPFGGFQQDVGLQFGMAILSDIQAFFFMSAAQGDSRANVMQAPKVTLTNGLMGQVMDMTQEPFVTSVNPIVGEFSAAYQPIITILNEGTDLRVQATVSGDRQYVRLTLNPVFNTIKNRTKEFRFTGSTESSTEETSKSKGEDTEEPEEKSKKTTSANAGVTIQQPVLASFTVMTTVTVPDGGTIVLGGVKRLREGRQEYGTPILNKIPFVNRLFMNVGVGRQQESILMMVTPRILIQEEEERYMLGQTP
ncbi:MAG: hypothetical protein ACRC10_01120 [Thermoguttaceae bacterium]